MVGLVFSRDRHGAWPEHYSAEVGGLVFELYAATVKSPPTIGTRIGFCVDSVDEVVPLLVGLGAEIISIPAESEWGRRAVIRDPDGHVVELLTPTDRERNRQ